MYSQLKILKSLQIWYIMKDIISFNKHVLYTPRLKYFFTKNMYSVWDGRLGKLSIATPLHEFKKEL